MDKWYVNNIIENEIDQLPGAYELYELICLQTCCLILSIN